MCSSRSARPWSRRDSSSSFFSISSSFARTRSSILSTCARRSVSSASISLRRRTACSRASTCASRRTASPSRRASSSSWSRILRAFVTPVVPNTETASNARAIPPAIPMAIPIPISTCSAPRSGIQPRRRHVPSGTGPARQLSEKPFSGRRRTCREPPRYLARDLRVVGRRWSIIGCGFGKAAFAGKTSNGMRRNRIVSHASSANRLATSSSVSARKAAATEPPQERRCDALALEQQPGTLELGLERGDRLGQPPRRGSASGSGRRGSPRSP